MKRFVSIPILLALMLGGCTSGIPDGAESAPDDMPSVEVEFLLGTDAELSASVRSDAPHGRSFPTVRCFRGANRPGRC